MNTKHVLVTGSSRGIGRAIALRLVQDGWKVAIHYAGNEEAAMEVAREVASTISLRNNGGGGLLGVYQADLSDPEQAVALLKRVTADHGLAALVNNAGVYRATDFLNDSEEETEREGNA